MSHSMILFSTNLLIFFLLGIYQQIYAYVKQDTSNPEFRNVLPAVNYVAVVF